mmetsp:Transcript_22470/g.57277  ORF Transcript_22470/g.57277 Transcript_22470/m.57277 type:complete len:224 (-) Transcript_22470:336-1007(-)
MVPETVQALLDIILGHPVTVGGLPIITVAVLSAIAHQAHGVPHETLSLLLTLHRAVLMSQGPNGRLLCLDLALNLGAGLALRHDFHSGQLQRRLLQQIQSSLHLGQEIVDSSNLAHAGELQQLTNIRPYTVLKEIYQLPVALPHPLRVQNLVPAADLEDLLEKLLLTRKLAALDKRLSGLVVMRHHNPGQNGTHLLDLHIHPPRLTGCAGHVGAVDVLRHHEG